MIEPTDNPSVRERIERQVRAAIMQQFDLPAKDVQRWAREGNDAEPDDAGELPPVWMVLHFPDEESTANAGEEAYDVDEWLLPYTIDVHLLTIPQGLTASEYANRWTAALHKLLVGDPTRTELDAEGELDPDGEQLAIDTRVASRFSPAPFNEQREVICGIEGEIHYRHAHADPWTVG